MRGVGAPSLCPGDIGPTVGCASIPLREFAGGPPEGRNERLDGASLQSTGTALRPLRSGDDTCVSRAVLRGNRRKLTGPMRGSWLAGAAVRAAGARGARLGTAIRARDGKRINHESHFTTQKQPRLVFHATTPVTHRRSHMDRAVLPPTACAPRVDRGHVPAAKLRVDQLGQLRHGCSVAGTSRDQERGFERVLIGTRQMSGKRFACHGIRCALCGSEIPFDFP
jgi:hypothetical protein